MKRHNENGRSMIEMLGVLAIIGVLTIGGFQTITTAMNKNKVSNLLSDTTQLAQLARKMVCQYDSGYNNYTVYLKLNNAYPSRMSYNKDNSKFIGEFDTKYSLSINQNNNIEILITGVPNDACAEMGITDWGQATASGFMGLQINDATDKYTSPLTLDAIAEKCLNLNSMKLYYRGCY